VLAWECSDPDGDPLRYDIYLGTSPDLAQPWMRYRSRSFTVPPQRMRAQACDVLRRIFVLEDAYHNEYDSYWLNGTTASYGHDGFYIMGVIIDSLDVYVYCLSASTNTFTCTATANLDNDATLDTWSIDETGVLSCSIDDFTLLADVGTTYYWRVCAQDDYGHSSLGPIWSYVATDTTN